MEEIFKSAKFKYKFRDYQQRALDEVHKYMSDKKINVIAAPGAGKTILAIQLMIELGEPTLVLAPTIALCEQWKERLTNDFIFIGINIEDYISDDIYNPNLITISTYQSLYSAYRKRPEKSKDINIVELLDKVKLKTVILDEAHHLKTAWHEATCSLLDKMLDIKTISLTATPPYDSDKVLWSKYVELCGEPDTEVTVAELVKNKNLAPHQDFICFNTLDEEQTKIIDEYSKKVKEFIKDLLNNDDFIMSLATHNMIVNPADNIEYILENFDYYNAVLKILQLKNIEVSIQEKYKINKYTLSTVDIENVLNYVFFKDKKSYNGFGTIKSQLNELGAIVENKISLKYTKNISDIIMENVGKLKSVEEIIKNEKRSMKEKLKAVIIVENIGKYALESDVKDINSIGAIPMFRKLSLNDEVIVLTGEIVLIPTSQKELLKEICKRENLDEDSFSIEELFINFDYCEVNFVDSKKRKMVGIITKLFEESNVNILVGTNALIGEGWDAPFINTLIIASSIAAYVTSNQIRGRAIRVDKKDKTKCANIWHLVSMEKGNNGNFVLGKDYEILARRFAGFEGVNFNKNEINYGIERVNITKENYIVDDVKEMNHRMFEISSNRAKICSSWDAALIHYVPIRKYNAKDLNRFNFYNNEINIKTLMDIYYRTPVVRYGRNTVNKLYLYRVCAAIFLLFGITFSSYSIIVFTLIGTLLTEIILHVLKQREKKEFYHLKKLAQGLLATLIQTRFISYKAKLCFNLENGEFYLEKADLKENTIFRQVFSEMLDKIDSPRYVITNGKEVYQVPAILGKNKKNVILLHQNIFGAIRKGILYTKTLEGKQLLLKIKMYQEELYEKQHRLDVLDKAIIENVENTKVDITATKIDIEVMKDVLESKNLIEEE